MYENLSIQELISRGMVTREQVDECRRAQTEITALGDPSLTLVDILILKGYLKAQDDLAPEPEAEQRLGPYFVDAKLGQGGMGTVYKARDGRKGPTVALKVLAPEFCGDREFVARFRREAGIALRLSHPNLVKGVGIGCVDERWYYAMEFVEGRKLSEVIEQRGKLPEPEAVGIATRVALALNAIDRAGLIHRDVNPGNIMITPKGDVKLMDLGLAKLSGTEASNVTRMGIRVARPNFMSPEQMASDPQLDIRTDIFSLGAVVYHMVTGRRPFDGPTPMDVIGRRRAHDLDDPKRFNPALSGALHAVILKAMARDRGGRYANPAEMLAELQRLPGATIR